jgi:VanZ family protein
MRKIPFAFSLLVAAAIIYFSALPGPEFGIVTRATLDSTILHFISYAAYASLLCLSFGARKAHLSVLAAAALGAATEIMQLFIQGRSCDFGDWLVDIAGALAATCALLLLSRAIKSKKWLP